jgi:hypothetical protein
MTSSVASHFVEPGGDSRWPQQNAPSGEHGRPAGQDHRARSDERLAGAGECGQASDDERPCRHEPHETSVVDT